MVEADSGMMGGTSSHEFMLLNERGEDDVVTCDTCDYAANAEHATSVKHERPKEPAQPLVEIATPGCTTIQAVAQFVGVPTSQMLKAVFMYREDREPHLVFVVIRGDLEVNETKLNRAIGGHALRRATDQEIQATGAVPGYASPIGLERGSALVIADDSVYLGSNLIGGANREGYHVKGIDPGRDLAPDIVTDIALVQDGDHCPRCAIESASDGREGRLRIQRGIELGHCFKLGTRYTAPANITYLAPDGQEQLIVMGSYGIGLGRLLAAIVETHNDPYGIQWPVAVAPYAIHLVSLVRAKDQVAEADRFYEALTESGLEVLYDDRSDLSAGVKFNDADLIGCPLRLTFSSRNLKQAGVEAKLRTSAERKMVPIGEAAEYARRVLGIGD
jgi:prolyl-tRNA synthetase